MTCTVHHSDCVAWLLAHDGPLFDACVTDPPYHLTSIVKRFGGDNAAPARKGKGDTATGAYARAIRGFMGKQWDGGDVAFRPETWRAVYDRLKPGAHLIAFSGTRTYHRMACAIEDAGFEIRDCLMWTYGSGFPKSHDVSKGIDKAAGVVREKVKTFNPRNPKASGGGRDGADGATRPWIETAMARGFHEKDGPVPATPEAAAWDGWGTALKPALEPICLARKPLSEKTVAANVLKWGTGGLNIDGCRIIAGDDPLQWAKPRGGIWKTDSQAQAQAQVKGRWPANLCHDGSDEVLAGFPETGAAGNLTGTEPSVPLGGDVFGNGLARMPTASRGDSGSAARFFYSAKAGPLDRIGTAHATVKPVDLMRWLVRLVTPPGGYILDPFAGSGTTGIAAMAEGFDCTMIEMEAEHVADIDRKLAFLRGEGGLSIIEQHKARIDRQAGKDGHGPLFGEVVA